ncbi:hypothetical protein GIB67_030901 [Kingdonia uniflora]|uniref:Pentatricopeptide repeat-containing protein n=1 Tax=Kingdonia uniflora TaxID=39325 RepID=A0A7J7L3H8_9MAGN|nr:hypothetical protein GIB67_030901 [Kingdonia uniflora]
MSKQVGYYNCFKTHQNYCFSSKPSYLLELILTNDWSEELEHELGRSNSTLNHETIIYILKKLEKDPQKTLNFFKWVSSRNGFKSSPTIYSVVLRNLGRKDSMKEFWVIIKRMSDEGYDFDKETYLSILAAFDKEKMKTDAVALTQYFNKMAQERSLDVTVKNVVDIVSGSDWDDGVKEKLGEMKLCLSRDSVLRILRDLCRYPLKALEFFRWVEEYQDCKHDTVTYNGIVRVLGQEESVKEFWSMVKEMKSFGYDIDIDTYIKLSRRLQKNHMIKDVVELYEMMMDSPYKPLLQECSTLLRKVANVDTPDLSLVYRVAKKYESAGHTLSKSVYDGIHRALTRVGKFDEADNILVTMRNAGYEPNNITFSQLVFGLCKAGRLEEACKTLDEMELQGCIPDIMTWTILIQGHLKAGEVDGALKCLTKMIGKNCFADAHLLEVLVSGLYSKNRLNSAYTLVVELVGEARLVPWQATYKYLIKMLLGERKLEEAFNILRLMKKHNFPPFTQPFGDYIAKNGTVEDARELLRMLSAKPSSAAYFNLLQSFLGEGRHSEAQDLFNTFPYHIRNDNNISSLFGSLKD